MTKPAKLRKLRNVMRGGFWGIWAMALSVLSAQCSSSHAFDSFFYSFRYKNEKLRFHFISRPTASGGTESVVSLVEQRLMMPDSEHAILFGRDLDGDSFPETWFLRGTRWAVTDSFIVEPPTNPGEDPAGQSAIQKIVPYIEENLHNRSLVGLTIGNTLEFLSFAISATEESGREYFRTQLDLYELRERAARVRDQQTSEYISALFNQGWSENNRMLLAATRGGQAWAYSAADLLTFGLAGTAVRYLERGGIWIAKKTGLTKFTGKIAHALAVKSLTGSALKAEINLTLRALSAQRAFIQKSLQLMGKQAQKVTHKGAVSILTIYREGVHSWQYVMQTQLMQILAEASARWEDVYDPNPIIIAKNLFSDKDFQQNFLYMTNETTLLTGISMREKTFGRKMRLCALMAAGNSSMMNFALRGNVDAERALFDSGWEITAGSLQTIFDTHMIHHFHEAAIKQKNPKLKLVGYAIAMIDQAVGYYAYSKITQRIAIIPVTVEEP